jgi:hypothetical protein
MPSTPIALQSGGLPGESLRELLHGLLREEEAHAGLAFGRGRDVDERVALELDRVAQGQRGAFHHHVERDVRARGFGRPMVARWIIGSTIGFNASALARSGGDSRSSSAASRAGSARRTRSTSAGRHDRVDHADGERFERLKFLPVRRP